MSKKIERVAREPRDSQSRDNRRRAGYWNYRDTMGMGGRNEQMAGIGNERGPTIGYKRDINSLL
jgi:hypothetical protein